MWRFCWRGENIIFISVKKKQHIDIDFNTFGTAMREHVVAKAKRYGSTIVYKRNGLLIAETPAIGAVEVLRPRVPSAGN